MERLTIQDMQQLAIDFEGKCLSQEYWGTDHDLTWRCERGHVFDMRPQFIRRGAWCPQCTIHDKKIAALELMQEWAEIYGGKCLSEKYINGKTPLFWECKNGHRFKKSRSQFKQSDWCSECKKIAALELMQEWAEIYGGKCLSEKYINDNTPLFWECKNGHRFKKSRSQFIVYQYKQRVWCSECKKIAALELMQEWAEIYGWKCLSEKYINDKTPLFWECKNGHRFEKSRAQFKERGWCSECKKIEHREKKLKEIKRIAKKRHGKCLSRAYINISTKLEFECGHGHRWKATPHIIKLDQSWCPYCYGHMRKTIDDMHKLAANKKGKCLSKKYMGVTMPLKWQCDKGHVWTTPPCNIISGTWCPKCNTPWSQKKGNTLR